MVQTLRAAHDRLADVPTPSLKCLRHTGMPPWLCGNWTSPFWNSASSDTPMASHMARSTAVGTWRSGIARNIHMALRSTLKCAPRCQAYRGSCVTSAVVHYVPFPLWVERQSYKILSLLAGAVAPSMLMCDACASGHDAEQVLTHTEEGTMGQLRSCAI